MNAKQLKFLVALPLAIGAVCVTTYLANKSSSVLNSLETLKLQSLPPIPEENIVPTSTEEPSQQASPPQSNEETPPPPPEQTTTPTSSTESESSPSVDIAGSDEDIFKVIREKLQEILSKYNNWIKDSNSLISSYEMTDRFTSLHRTLQQLQKQYSDQTQQ